MLCQYVAHIPLPETASAKVPSNMACVIGNAMKSEGIITRKIRIASVAVSLASTALRSLSVLSIPGQTLEAGSLSLKPRYLINTNAAMDPRIRAKLVKERAPSRPALFATLMNIGPFSNVPATMKVAPVSDKDLANERTKAAISEGLIIGDVTVRKATNGTAPKVLEALSNSWLLMASSFVYHHLSVPTPAARANQIIHTKLPTLMTC
jgi:hypothetical protein